MEFPVTLHRRRERRVGDAARKAVAELLPQQGLRRDRLIEYLHALNDHFGHLRTDHMAALAEALRLAQAEVYEVASFYHHFEVVREGPDGAFTAAPRLTVRVCDGLPCVLAGAEALLDKLPALLGAEVRVVRAPCVGRCEQAPAVVVHQFAVAQATPDRVVQSVNAGERDATLGPAIGLGEYVAQGGYRLLRDCLAGRRDADAVIGELEQAGLRGLGGAGFPAGRKWRIVREQPAPRLMAVNIDEGEPGTFKDRFYLESDPHRFIEGLLVAAWAVGVEAVYVYLRDEYHGARALLARELAALPELGLTLPTIELRRGAGAYVCGEESAMIESIEGKRGLPRLRPPYVAQVGLFGRPTLEHNYETLHWVRDIVERGRGVVRRSGSPRAQGSALVLGLRAREVAGCQAGAGGHHAA